MEKQSDVVQARWKFIRKADMEFLRELIAMLPMNSICVNIGAGMGTSGLVMREALNVKCSYTVDIEPSCGGGDGGMGNETNAFIAAGFDPQDARHVQMIGDSAVVGKNWKEPLPLIDMIFIDGGHNYEQCRDDIAAWLPHVVEQGIIAVHDYFPETDHDGPLFPGVKRAVNEGLLDKYELIAQKEITIAFRKARI